jgi:sec-independent protein translocase protein TatC
VVAGNEANMGFIEHLEELRRRLIVCMASVLVVSIVGYYFAEQMIDFLIRPVGEVYFMSPTEAFGVRIKISLFAGLLVSVPVILFQVWRFVVPGLYKHEIRLVVPVVFFGTLFFLIGAAFCFVVVLPVGVKFLIGFGTEHLKPLISVGSYLSFAAWMVLAFGVVFELPVISFFLGKAGVISARTLRKGRRYAIVGILLVAGAITPSPDVFSQLMLAGPLYFLYEVSIILVHYTGKRKPGDERQADKAASSPTG